VSYRVDSRLDRVIERDGEGRDTVVSGKCAVVLGKNIEAGMLTGDFDLALVGNELGNRLVGNDGDNHIRGGGGLDIMTGGEGRDSFVFRALLDSSGSAADRILDFIAGEDTIDLHGIDADETLAGDQAFVVVSHLGGAAGAIRWFGLDRAGTASDLTVIEAETSGDGRADLKIVLSGLVALTADDFLL
jgi:serralysin